VATILKLMNDESANLRKPAVKSLNQIISSDPRLMFHKAVKKSVAKCFVDDAVSVREAAVTLVGNYVLNSPRVASAYHESLLDRLTDKGVSVRKSVVKLFKEVLLSHPNYPHRVATCVKLVRCFADPKEEESNKTIVYVCATVLGARPPPHPPPPQPVFAATTSSWSCGSRTRRA
jgi:cohesin loading factor subunit SCC2